MSDIIDPEIVDAIPAPLVRRSKRLTLDRTNDYIAKHKLDEMTPDALIEFLLKQADVKLALIGDQVLATLEYMEDAPTASERRDLAASLAALTKAAAEVSAMKQAFEKSLGRDIEAKLQQIKSAAVPAQREMTPEEFAEAYAEATAATGTVPVPPAQV
jgi:hypothetical protein